MASGCVRSSNVEGSECATVCHHSAKRNSATSRKEARRAGRAARRLALYPSETSSEESMSSSCDDGWETTSHR